MAHRVDAESFKSWLTSFVDDPGPYFEQYSDLIGLWETTTIPDVFDWTVLRIDESASSQPDQAVLLPAILGDTRAVVLMSAWKVRSAAEYGHRALVENDVIGGAVGARAALESSFYAIRMSQELMTLVRRGAAGNDVREPLAELDERNETALWGSKIPDAPQPALNVLTNLQWVVRSSGDAQTEAHLDNVYTYLSEVVHPSSFGFQSFMHWTEGQVIIGRPQTVRASRRTLTPNAALTQSVSRWAVGWSTAWTLRAAEAVYGLQF